jgi:hypothetical protein
MVIGLVVIFILIVIFDLKDILKKSKDIKKYILIYFVIIMLGLTLSILQIIDKPPVSPSKVIESVIKTVVGE